ncbi:MAG: bioB [Burkholderiaceae bacterium]|nr:bioB [Burkholderiaceae bacterium]
MSQVVSFHPPAAPVTLPTDATWPVEDIIALFELPLNELLSRAQEAHKAHFPEGDVELATLISIKTGGCEEDCGYCSQSSHHETELKASKILPLDEILEAARAAKANGATRFCMGASGRSPKERDMPKYEEIVRSVKALGLETCATLGMLREEQALRLKEAGLDYYNHNLDTSPEYYPNVISTRNYQERLDTLGRVRSAGLKVCCGGIIGMGESRRDRAGLLAQLANLNPYPNAVPINHLVPIAGTPLANVEPLDSFEFVRTIAVARIIMPKARVRLSAGRESMSEAEQALCFMAGANSIFYGEKLLTTGNAEAEKDRALLKKLGLKIKEIEADHHHHHDHD